MGCLDCIRDGAVRIITFFLPVVILGLYLPNAVACDPVEYPLGDFPYPSDFYVVNDEGSPTGKRLNLCNALASDDAINGVEAGDLWWWPVQFEGELFQQAIAPLATRLSLNARDYQ